MNRLTFFSYLSISLLICCNPVESSAPVSEDETHERHLPKDTKFMKKASPETFLVDDEAFDRIHEKAHLGSSNYNPSASFIEGKSGVCSAVLVGLYEKDKKTIGEFLTAKHCLEASPTSIYQGLSSSVYKGHDLGQGFLAHFQAFEGCVDKNGSEDIGLVRAELKTLNITEETLSKTPAKIAEYPEEGVTLGIMHHYPLGNPTQRVNEGAVGKEEKTSASSPRRKHEISSLPGSSGAGIFTNRGILFAIHSGGEPNSNTGSKAIYQISGLEGVSIEKRTHEIAEYNKAYSITRDYFNKLINCTKIDTIN